jgi:chromosome partitioning protein
MSRIIALANQKGGVGKTTSVINIGVALAKMGQRVLLIDFDSQGALTAGLGVEGYGLRRTIYNALLEPDTTLSQVIITIQPNLDLAPANNDLAAAETELIPEIRRELTLRRTLQTGLQNYDFIFLDCPPSLSLLTTNALCASDEVIVPLQCEYFAMRGLQLLLDNIAKVRGLFNPSLELSGILPTMYSSRTNHAREVLAELKDVFGDKVFDEVIRKSIRFADASLAGEAIVDIEPDHKGSLAYRAVAERILAQKTAK